LLRAVSHSFEVSDRYLTKPFRSLNHLLLVTIVDTPVLPNNEFTAQKTKLTYTTKLNKYRDTELPVLGPSPQFAVP